MGRGNGGVINTFTDLRGQFWRSKRATMENTNAIEDKVDRVVIYVEGGKRMLPSFYNS